MNILDLRKSEPTLGQQKPRPGSQISEMEDIQNQQFDSEKQQEETESEEGS